MSGKRQKTQYSLALAPNSRGETRAVGSPRAEPLMAKPAPESPAVTEQLMDEVCDRENLESAWKRVKRNQGSPGVDGVTWDAYGEGLEHRLVDLHGRIHRGAYRAQPSRRVYIPKPDGRQRPLGIATWRA